MVANSGHRVDYNFLLGLKHVKDLLYYDGPLLSEFESKHKEKYLFSWVDLKGEYNRWLVLKVNPDVLNLYLSGALCFYSLHEVGETFYLADINSEGEIERAYKLDCFSDIPEEYLPEKDLYYENREIQQSV